MNNRDLVQGSIQTLQEELARQLQNEMASLITEIAIDEPRYTGEIVSYADGIAEVSGLLEAGYGDGVLISSGDMSVPAIVMDLEPEIVKCMVLAEEDRVSIGSRVELGRPGELRIQIPTLDEKETEPLLVGPLLKDSPSVSEVDQEVREAVHRAPLSVFQRGDISTQLLTGYPIVDLLLPISKGQRMLILGDRGTSKTRFCLEAIRKATNADPELRYVYVAIAKEANAISHIRNELRGGSKGVIVATTSSDSPGLHYLAPFTGMYIAEEWRSKGKDVVIVLDDLTQHAAAYRQISLLLRRPPGREAYPGDLHYIHARLLERAGCARNAGSITALPLIETQEEDYTGYLPTSIISITDGQLYFDLNLVNRGIFPAINPDISVSRIEPSIESPFAGEVRRALRASDIREVKRLLRARLQGNDTISFGKKEQVGHNRIAMEFLYRPSSTDSISLLASLLNQHESSNK